MKTQAEIEQKYVDAIRRMRLLDNSLKRTIDVPGTLAMLMERRNEEIQTVKLLAWVLDIEPASDARIAR